MRMFCFVFNFQVNYGKLLWFLKVAASDDPQQSKRVVDRSPRRTQGGRPHSQRCHLLFVAGCPWTSGAIRGLDGCSRREHLRQNRFALRQRLACAYSSLSLSSQAAWKAICSNCPCYLTSSTCLLYEVTL